MPLPASLLIPQRPTLPAHSLGIHPRLMPLALSVLMTSQKLTPLPHSPGILPRLMPPHLSDRIPQKLTPPHLSLGIHPRPMPLPASVPMTSQRPTQPPHSLETHPRQTLPQASEQQ